MIKITCEESSQTKITIYPYLGIAENYNLIVLFIKHGEGTVLKQGTSPHLVGGFSKKWDMSLFCPLEKDKVVTMQNV